MHIWHTASDLQLQRWQDVKELVRSAGDALSIGFLGSLESFLTYLQALMHFCESFARDEKATKAMLVRSLSITPQHVMCCTEPADHADMSYISVIAHVNSGTRQELGSLVWYSLQSAGRLAWEPLDECAAMG